MTDDAAAFSAAWNKDCETSGKALFTGPDGGVGLALAEATALAGEALVPFAAAAAAALAAVSDCADAAVVIDTIATPAMRNFKNVFVVIIASPFSATTFQYRTRLKTRPAFLEEQSCLYSCLRQATYRRAPQACWYAAALSERAVRTDL